MLTLTNAFLISIGINLAMFIPAYRYKTDKLTDISYAVTFVTLAIYGYFSSAHTNSHKLAYYMVLAWAFRLGYFLFSRVKRVGKDRRFDGMRSSFWLFLRFWVLQGLTAFVVMLAALMLWQQNLTLLNPTSWLGLMVFVLGLVLEATADAQKAAFSQKNKSKKWIDVGVWRSSRHPNYLGEMMIWLGMYFFAYSSLKGASAALGLISPDFIIVLLCFASGIPILEKSSDKKWGEDKDYQRYKQEVPLLVPSPQSILRTMLYHR